MSFGYHEANKLSKFRKTLAKAVKRKVSALLFAAASNGGGNHGRAFPARLPNVFCIHATDAFGNGSNFNPTALAEDGNYSIIGQDLLAADPAQTVSGTSYATPIAAGLAATLLEFLKQKWHPRDEDKVRTLHELQEYHVMAKVFKMIAQRRHSYDYLCPWRDLFDLDRNDEDVCSMIAKALKY